MSIVGAIGKQLLRQNTTTFQWIRNYRRRKPNKTTDLTPVIAPDVEPPPGVNFYVHNRNPRNLERLRIAFKNNGWGLELPGRTYWHKLVITDTRNGVTASLLHIDGKTVLSTSTSDWDIRQFIVSGRDRNAYLNLGRVFAQRCLQCGITEITSFYNPQEDGKLAVLLRALEDGGISLKEPRKEKYKDSKTKQVHQFAWDVAEP